MPFALGPEDPASPEVFAILFRFCRGVVLSNPRRLSFTNRLCDNTGGGAGRIVRLETRRTSFTRRLCDFVDLLHAVLGNGLPGDDLDHLKVFLTRFLLLTRRCHRSANPRARLHPQACT